MKTVVRASSAFPAADHPAGLVELPRRVAIVADIEIFEHGRQPEEEAQLLNAGLARLSAALRSRE